MRLGEILDGCEYSLVTDSAPGVGSCQSAGNKSDKECLVLDTEISGIAYDSRRVEEGSLFAAVRGENLDGHRFISHALARGAAAVVAERDPREGHHLPFYIRVPDSRKLLACISNNFYRRPSEEVPVIGVTGTNGKTTTTYLMKSILEAWGKDVGLIGTIRYLIGETSYPASHTTPEAPEFQELLRRMISAGCRYVVAEISSHSLSLKRVDYTRFKAAVFTNLTRDHLDFHGTMDDYFEAKKRLFSELLPEEGIAVINADDLWGARLLREMEKRNVVTYGIISEADVTATGIDHTFSGTSLTIMGKDGKRSRIESPLLGTANTYNILAAAAAALAMDVPIDAIQKGVRSVSSIDGRLEKIDEGQGFLCIVDYAHTPDALERLITTARELILHARERGRLHEVSEEETEPRAQDAKPRIITVFGCGGNRDRGKRPLMGGIASRLSDEVFITSDNPRKEDPQEIIKEIESGIIEDNVFSVPDRREAITMAVERAGRGDIVIIAGKGHEEYQEIGEKRHRFSDREVVSEAIRNRLKRMQDG
ncbi:MAG TPA: UDP-N-acetylmuramoyl-L-alanyl-D-glutamate--2,6-diaminopimelate ligase [Thermodesulfovibrionales bacterium]|nr:UDP-N-acetylmuramoyl-L-alanyl-D-glutamate--2,6-diaminopimelate ligase [Thermodesulfovibrionales bacterium]